MILLSPCVWDTFKLLCWFTFSCNSFKLVFSSLQSLTCRKGEKSSHFDEKETRQSSNSAQILDITALRSCLFSSVKNEMLVVVPIFFISLDQTCQASLLSRWMTLEGDISILIFHSFWHVLLSTQDLLSTETFHPETPQTLNKQKHTMRQLLLVFFTWREEK